MSKMKTKSMKKKNIFVFMNILLIIGMLISLFLVYEHFSKKASKFCTFGSSFDCGIVNKSPYANLDGLSYLLTIELNLPLPLIKISDKNIFFDFITSNAFLGFLTLSLLLFLIRANYKGKKFLFIEKEKTFKWVKGITLFSIIYGFYLFLIQHFILKTYCVFCLVLDVILLMLFVILWSFKK